MRVREEEKAIAESSEEKVQSTESSVWWPSTSKGSPRERERKSPTTSTVATTTKIDRFSPMDHHMSHPTRYDVQGKKKRGTK